MGFISNASVSAFFKLCRMTSYIFLGEYGSYLYVASEGEFDVIKDGKVLGRLGVGKAFGELAILYNCKRTASIKAVTDGKVWALERTVFQQVMVSSGMKKMENQVLWISE